MKIKEVIIVEGRYDKIAVKNAVDAAVIETSGFGVFSDKEKIALIRKLAQEKGIIVLTDSDGAGLVIRNYLKGAVGANVKNAYIPEMAGKERRKNAPSKENLLGVEGMDRDIIINALLRAGATVEDGENDTAVKREEISSFDMYDLGLSGGVGSTQKRERILRALSLPTKMSAKAMREVLNLLFTREEFIKFYKENI